MRRKNALAQTGSEKEWSDSKEFQDYAAYVLNERMPHMKAAAVVMVIAPNCVDLDVKIAVEIGLGIILDKPLILIAPHGRHIADRLLRIADHVIPGDPSTEEGRNEINRTLDQLLSQYPAGQTRPC